MKHVIYIFIISIFLFDCETKNTEEVLPKEEVSSVLSAILPEKVSKDEAFEIKFKISVSGCWTYSRIQTEESDDEILITVYTKDEFADNPDVLCATAFFEENIVETLRLKSAGDKLIRFSNSEIQKSIKVE